MVHVIWITPQLPCLRSGGQVRQYHLLRYLCARHHVTVLSLVREEEIEAIGALENLGAEVITKLFIPPKSIGLWRNRLKSWSQLLFDPWPHYARTYPIDSLRNSFREILKKYSPDILHFEHLFTAPLSELAGCVPWVLTEQNAESHIAGQQSRQALKGTHRLAGKIESRKLCNWEQKWVRRSAACIAVSEVDAEILRCMASDTLISVIPNGVDSAYFTPREGITQNREGLLFLGNLSYMPNADGIQYFCKEIFPRIRSYKPQITLNIVGLDATPEIMALGELPGVRFIGFVADIRPHLWNSAVCVVPLRMGGGTRLKILESLAAGCPVVSTTVGAEGLDVKNGQDLLIGDDPQTFAHHVLKLIDEPLLAQSMSKFGMQKVEACYDWQAIAPRLEQIYQSVLGRNHGRERDKSG